MLPNTGVDIAALVVAAVTGLGVIVGLVIAAVLAFSVVLRVRRYLSGDSRSNYEVWLDGLEVGANEEQDRDQRFRY